MRLIVVFAALFTTTAVHGQQPSADPVIVTGCLARAIHDGSLAGSPGVPPASPNTAPTLANSSEPTSAFVLNGAIVKSATAAKPRTFTLDGGSQPLDAHVGHRMEVTGTIVRAYGGAKAGDKEPVDHIRVASIKMLGTRCVSEGKE